ncbi:MAG: BACON domain-containing protein [Mediterranea sp.]|jgi:hypothetical protein|nr:BACON domain-containing protein [Mediterranea sp.]
MKQSLFLFVLILSLYACKDSQAPAMHTLTFNKNSVEFTYQGSKDTLIITANAPWTIESYPKWIGLSATQGEADTQLLLVADYNADGEKRIGTICFKQDDNIILLEVSQAAAVHDDFSLRMLANSYFEEIKEDADGHEFLFSYHNMHTPISPNMFAGAYVGNMIDGRITRGNPLKEYKGLHYLPITVSSNLPEPDTTFVPSRQAQDEYVTALFSKHPKTSVRFKTDNKGVSFYSHEQLHLLGKSHLDIALDEAVSDASYKDKPMTKKHGIIFSFAHTKVSLAMDNDAVIKETLKPEDFVGETPSIVMSVDYGNIGLLIVESDYPPELIRKLFNAVCYEAMLDEQEQLVYEEMKGSFVRFDSSGKMYVHHANGDAMRQYLTYLTLPNEDIYPIEMSTQNYFTGNGASPVTVSLRF